MKQSLRLLRPRGNRNQNRLHQKQKALHSSSAPRPPRASPHFDRQKRSRGAAEKEKNTLRTPAVPLASCHARALSGSSLRDPKPGGDSRRVSLTALAENITEEQPPCQKYFEQRHIGRICDSIPIGSYADGCPSQEPSPPLPERGPRPELFRRHAAASVTTAPAEDEIADRQPPHPSRCTHNAKTPQLPPSDRPLSAEEAELWGSLLRRSLPDSFLLHVCGFKTTSETAGQEAVSGRGKRGEEIQETVKVDKEGQRKREAREEEEELTTLHRTKEKVAMEIQKVLSLRSLQIRKAAITQEENAPEGTEILPVNDSFLPNTTACADEERELQNGSSVLTGVPEREAEALSKKEDAHLLKTAAPPPIPTEGPNLSPPSPPEDRTQSTGEGGENETVLLCAKADVWNKSDQEQETPEQSTSRLQRIHNECGDLLPRDSSLLVPDQKGPDIPQVEETEDASENPGEISGQQKSETAPPASLPTASSPQRFEHVTVKAPSSHSQTQTDGKLAKRPSRKASPRSPHAPSPFPSPRKKSTSKTVQKKPPQRSPRLRVGLSPRNTVAPSSNPWAASEAPSCAHQRGDTPSKSSAHLTWVPQQKRGSPKRRRSPPLLKTAQEGTVSESLIGRASPIGKAVQERAPRPQAANFLLSRPETATQDSESKLGLRGWRNSGRNGLSVSATDAQPSKEEWSAECRSVLSLFRSRLHDIETAEGEEESQKVTRERVAEPCLRNGREGEGRPEQFCQESPHSPTPSLPEDRTSPFCFPFSSPPFAALIPRLSLQNQMADSGTTTTSQNQNRSFQDRNRNGVSSHSSLLDRPIKQGNPKQTEAKKGPKEKEQVTETKQKTKKGALVKGFACRSPRSLTPTVPPKSLTHTHPFVSATLLRPSRSARPGTPQSTSNSGAPAHSRVPWVPQFRVDSEIQQDAEPEAEGGETGEDPQARPEMASSVSFKAESPKDSLVRHNALAPSASINLDAVPAVAPDDLGREGEPSTNRPSAPLFTSHTQQAGGQEDPSVPPPSQTSGKSGHQSPPSFISNQTTAPPATSSSAPPARAFASLLSRLDKRDFFDPSDTAASFFEKQMASEPSPQTLSALLATTAPPPLRSLSVLQNACVQEEGNEGDDLGTHDLPRQVEREEDGAAGDANRVAMSEAERVEVRTESNTQPPPDPSHSIQVSLQSPRTFSAAHSGRPVSLSASKGEEGGETDNSGSVVEKENDEGADKKENKPILSLFGQWRAERRAKEKSLKDKENEREAMSSAGASTEGPLDSSLPAPSQADTSSIHTTTEGVCRSSQEKDRGLQGVQENLLRLLQDSSLPSPQRTGSPRRSFTSPRPPVSHRPADPHPPSVLPTTLHVTAFLDHSDALSSVLKEKGVKPLTLLQSDHLTSSVLSKGEVAKETKPPQSVVLRTILPSGVSPKESENENTENDNDAHVEALFALPPSELPTTASVGDPAHTERGSVRGTSVPFNSSQEKPERPALTAREEVHPSPICSSSPVHPADQEEPSALSAPASIQPTNRRDPRPVPELLRDLPPSPDLQQQQICAELPRGRKHIQDTRGPIRPPPPSVSLSLSSGSVLTLPSGWHRVGGEAHDPLNHAEETDDQRGGGASSRAPKRPTNRPSSAPSGRKDARANPLTLRLPRPARSLLLSRSPSPSAPLQAQTQRHGDQTTSGAGRSSRQQEGAQSLKVRAQQMTAARRLGPSSQNHRSDSAPTGSGLSSHPPHIPGARLEARARARNAAAADRITAAAASVQQDEMERATLGGQQGRRDAATSDSGWALLDELTEGPDSGPRQRGERRRRRPGLDGNTPGSVGVSRAEDAIREGGHEGTGEGGEFSQIRERESPRARAGSLYSHWRDRGDEEDDSAESDAEGEEAAAKGGDAGKRTEERLKCTICLERVRKPKTEASLNSVASLESLTPARLLRQPQALSCGHVFHSGCVQRWIRTSPCCPLCKTKVFSQQNDFSDTVGSPFVALGLEEPSGEDDQDPHDHGASLSPSLSFLAPAQTSDFESDGGEETDLIADLHGFPLTLNVPVSSLNLPVQPQTRNSPSSSSSSRQQHGTETGSGSSSVEQSDAMGEQGSQRERERRRGKSTQRPPLSRPRRPLGPPPVPISAHFPVTTAVGVQRREGDHGEGMPGPCSRTPVSPLEGKEGRQGFGEVPTDPHRESVSRRLQEALTRERQSGGPFRGAVFTNQVTIPGAAPSASLSTSQEHHAKGEGPSESRVDWSGISALLGTGCPVESGSNRGGGLVAPRRRPSPSGTELPGAYE
uniref:RING-type E3 ubiquitin transferase n=1 Tax=Chromera velia CCMP2878 TaxID=1169474 RepID=A0A0G4HAW1_9ALVE|eukprot:Cvel_6137.t1-p1 / transcript=Cvel_6137.t1 / gene=Cvel_6137 / organism=Chromera_velia_CCMP2878 / gene_product=hypothetical protein / transcript_product=hypothetical protein / location=Cvel_scaffold296:79751-87881(+) / protein_length=2265 / sequence_SO=supercontig / SO=protein_coding / is_pseudo=false